MQRLANLKLSGHRREGPQTQSKIQENPVTFKEPTIRKLICNKCDLDHKSSDDLEEHIDTHYEDGDFACDTCLFQSNKMKLLKNHLLNSPGHSSGQVRGKPAIKCKFCEERFIDTKLLVRHKNKNHKTYKICDYFKEGKCKRSPCRYSHKVIKEGNCVCFHCGKEFSQKHDLYNHRKSDHKNEVCKNFMVNKCERTEEECWFSHVKNVNTSSGRTSQAKDTPVNTDLPDFWQGRSNLVPPTQVLDMKTILKTIEESVQQTIQRVLKELKISA